VKSKIPLRNAGFPTRKAAGLYKTRRVFGLKNRASKIRHRNRESVMKTWRWFGASVLILLGCTASAQSGNSVPAGDYQQGFKNGFDAGFKDGYDRAVQDIRARQAMEQNVARPQQQVAPGGAAVVGSTAVPVRPAIRNRGIVLVRAWYSQEGRNTATGACDLTSRLVKEMNGRVSASIDVSNQLCGDPAPGKRKSLKAVYLCGGEEREAEAHEHRSLRLSCE
jgi:hypothetical protein